MGLLLILFLVFLVVTTFFKIDLAKLNTDCGEDLVLYKYTNKITGDKYTYGGDSACKPKLLGFFWEESEVSLLEAKPDNENQ